MGYKCTQCNVDRFGQSFPVTITGSEYMPDNHPGRVVGIDDGGAVVELLRPDNGSLDWWLIGFDRIVQE